jgi:methionyl-tRNA synthetase
MTLPHWKQMRRRTAPAFRRTILRTTSPASAAVKNTINPISGLQENALSSYYITTPIYYVNAKPHLGHTYTTVVADALKRFHAMKGEDARMLTGTDEHGDKIVKAAEATGKTPQAFTDEISGEFRALWEKLGIVNDDFIRTTDPRHKASVQALLQRIYDKGDI